MKSHQAGGQEWKTDAMQDVETHERCLAYKTPTKQSETHIVTRMDEVEPSETD